jgi:hypothetical protein
LIDSFIDFKGIEHKVIICALTQTPESNDYDLMVSWVNDHNEVDTEDEIYSVVKRCLSIGIAICNPNDDFNEELGKKIALSKAENNIPVLVSTEIGVMNKILVNAYMQQEMAFIKKNPGKFIKGYDESEKKFLEHNKLMSEVEQLTTEEKNLVRLLLSDDKYFTLAKKLMDKEIYEI